MVHKFFQDPEWYKLRRRALIRDGFKCCWCRKSLHGKGNAHVDHKIPRRIAPRLALELSNLQSLCPHCHNSIKQKDELNPDRGCNESGLPNDPDSIWHDE